MKKYTLTIASVILGLAAALSTSTAFAQAQYAIALGVYPQCSGCHATTDDSSGNGGTNRNRLRGSVWNRCTAPQVLNTTKHLCEIPSTVPISPTCTGKQVLDVVKNLCVTPVPVCNGATVLNAAKDTCIKPPPPTCVLPQILDATQTACITPPTKVNTNPVLNAVAPQWDAKVGELISIPLSVKDAEQDAFMMTGSVNGSKFSAVHPDAAGLPSIDFTWKPTATQVNKIFTVTFQAKETNTAQKLVSNKVAVKIRVWAAGDKSAASITKLNVITSKWAAGKLTLAGNVVINSLLTLTEKQAFIAQKLDLTVSSSNGTLIGSTPLTLDAKGNWSVVLPVAQSACDIILQFDGQNAARTVTGCVKPVAAVTAPITVANNAVNPFKGVEYEDDEHHADGHDD
jgi:hypothetical protein